MKSFFIGNIEIKTPVIQGGMGVGISLSGLASAVANEGGVGVISCAGLGLLYPKGKGTYPEKCINGLKEEIRKARAKTKGIIGVNVMVALSNYADMVRTAIEEKNTYTFKITHGEDTRDGSELWVVRIEETLTKDEYIRINKAVKDLGGYYSKFKHGFIFRFEPSEALKKIA